MVYKEHYIEIYVNGKLLELESQDSLNLRFQNTLPLLFLVFYVIRAVS